MNDQGVSSSAQSTGRKVNTGPRQLTGPWSARAFVLTVSYTVPTTRIDELLGAHRDWLDEHFSAGTFLVSGPRVPRDGGVILATGTSKSALEALVRTDPFVRANAATYDVMEFVPTRGPLVDEESWHMPQRTAQRQGQPDD